MPAAAWSPRAFYRPWPQWSKGDHLSDSFTLHAMDNQCPLYPSRQVLKMPLNRQIRALMPASPPYSSAPLEASPSPITVSDSAGSGDRALWVLWDMGLSWGLGLTWQWEELGRWRSRVGTRSEKEPPQAIWEAGHVQSLLGVAASGGSWLSLWRWAGGCQWSAGPAGRTRN